MSKSAATSCRGHQASPSDSYDIPLELFPEAATSHGPVDAKRPEELVTLFGSSTA